MAAKRIENYKLGNIANFDRLKNTGIITPEIDGCKLQFSFESIAQPRFENGIIVCRGLVQPINHRRPRIGEQILYLTSGNRRPEVISWITLTDVGKLVWQEGATS
ncbi:MAG: hypothetical protein WDN47_02150 [Candidatus Doudnabacteria bacterium]